MVLIVRRWPSTWCLAPTLTPSCHELYHHRPLKASPGTIWTYKKLVYQRTRPSSSWQRDCWGRSHRKVRCWPAFVFKEPVRVQIRQGKGVYISPRQNWLDGITTAVRSACMLPLSVELSVGVYCSTLCVARAKLVGERGHFQVLPSPLAVKFSKQHPRCNPRCSRGPK